MSHIKPLQIRLEGDFGVIPLLLLCGRYIFDLWFVSLVHVILPHLFELFPCLDIHAFHDEFFGEDVGQFGSVAVASARGFLFVVVKVGSLWGPGKNFIVS
jgi:hypothetical protein